MTKEEFIAWAIGKGWHIDRYGHLQKILDGKHYRIKIGKTSVRYESMITFSDGKNEWARLRSGYYKNLSLTSDDKLAGLKLGI